MSVKQEHLTELLDVIHEADTAIMEVYNANSAVVETKADNTPVTQADIASHKIILGGLTRLFPNIPVVSEEGNREYNVRTVLLEKFWLVDPLDGTKEFLARTGQFSVCAALIEGGLPTFGIVSAPATGVTYYGGPEIGSFRLESGSRVPIHVPQQRVGVVLGSRSDLNERTSQYIATNYPGAEVKQVGSQLKLPQIAEGLADAYPRLDGPLHLWDLAAGHAILEGAGGTVTRPDGSSIDYNNQSLKAGDFIASS